MKTYLSFLIIVLFIGTQAFAQSVDTITFTGKKRFYKLIIFQNDTSQDTSSTHIMHIHSSGSPHWSGIGWGINSLINSKGDFDYANDPNLDLDYGKSWSFYFNFSQFMLPIIKNNVGLVTGIGIHIKNYRFLKNNLTLLSDDTLSYLLDQTKTYSKSKLTLTYLTVPLLLQISTNNDYFFAFGASASLLLKSHTKQKTSSGDKIKNNQLPYLQPVNYGALIQLGHNDFTIFASYNLISVFKKNRGPEALPLDFGFLLNF